MYSIKDLPAVITSIHSSIFYIFDQFTVKSNFMKTTQFHQPAIISTSDGSSTLTHPVLEELYHSRHGAWTESQHIFIQYGLMPFIEKSPEFVTIFEMGFGSGLNAAMTREVAQVFDIPVKYVTIELYPVRADIVSRMTMPKQSEEERKRWLELHRTKWNEEVILDRHFSLNKYQCTFPDKMIPERGFFDVVFYDAFAPGAQPELWGLEALGCCFELLKPNGAWISYCSKGSVKRNLRKVGFEVEGLPGPPGKREITRALKK